MRNFTKFIAVVLVMIIAVSMGACSMTPQWSYRYEDTELSMGAYIYALYSAYNQAQTYAQETDVYDSETQKYDGKDSFLKVTITDEDGTKATADQWIETEADLSLRTILAIDSELERLSATVDQTTMDGYKMSAKEYWDYGPYYAMYGDQYLSPYADIYEPIGVSYESFELFYVAAAKQEALFDAIYGAKGEKPVSDKELTEYFEDTYTSYSFFTVDLYETEETVDDAGETSSVSTALSDKEIKKYKSAFEGYVNDVNAGKSFDDVLDAYMADYDIEEDPSTSNVEIMEDSTIGAELVDEINKLKEGQASYVIMGEGDSQVLYMFYKEPISKQTKNYIQKDTNRGSVLQSYKGEEFTDYVQNVAKELKVTVNKAINKYSPKMFDKINQE